MENQNPTGGVSRELIEALVSLEGMRAWEVFLDHLKDRNVKFAAASVAMHDDTQCRWVQGRVQETSDILKIIEDARSAMERFKNNGGAV